MFWTVNAGKLIDDQLRDDKQPGRITEALLHAFSLYEAKNNSLEDAKLKKIDLIEIFRFFD